MRYSPRVARTAPVFGSFIRLEARSSASCSLPVHLAKPSADTCRTTSSAALNVDGFKPQLDVSAGGSIPQNNLFTRWPSTADVSYP
jgi:hypothetical protein